MWGSIFEKCPNFGKNGRFSRQIWPDWGNTAWADMAGLGSIDYPIYLVFNHILVYNGLCVLFGILHTLKDLGSMFMRFEALTNYGIDIIINELYKPRG